MDMYEIIRTKRDGEKLTKEQIEFFVQKSVCGEIPDYQISALLMAIFLNKMDEEETLQLTRTMKESGSVLDLSDIQGIKIDKHSTGGIGDKATLIAAPIAAAAGVPVAKMSGRGLGFTGGTIDKLESIPGYTTDIAVEDFMRQVNFCGIALIGQTKEVASADKIFYALRDVTATVDNISLIASSILSKKLALGSDGILFDIKCGEGAFMKNLRDAEDLGRLMVETVRKEGKKAMAVISDMNQPLGRAVGNSIEVIESIEVLKGKGSEDITELSLTLAGLMIYMGEKVETPDMGIKKAREVWNNGSALDKFKNLIDSQGGNSEVCDDYGLMPSSNFEVEYLSRNTGYVKNIKGDLIGRSAMHTGAGRLLAGDEISYGSGIYMIKKVGEFVEKGDVLCKIYTDDRGKLELVEGELEKAFEFSRDKVLPGELIKKIIY